MLPSDTGNDTSTAVVAAAAAAVAASVSSSSAITVPVVSHITVNFTQCFICFSCI